jgi:glycerol-3-phosphate acyltransferase PlsY
MPELSPALLGKLAVCFLLGSIPFAILSMWGSGVDITKFGSGNPGFNNVLRYSKWRSVICLAGDAGKGLLAIWLFSGGPGTEIADWLSGLAAILGHCYSPFLKFNGGKGIATAAGVMLYLYPLVLLPCVAWYVVWRIIGAKLNWTERGTIASLTASLLFVVQLLIFHSFQIALMGLVLLAFVAFRHRKNFENIASAAKPR